MRFFFRSKQFRIILAVFAVVVLLSAIFAFLGSRIAPQADIAGTIAAPFQSFATKVSNAVSDFISAYTDGNELMLENAELKGEINQLREQVADYNDIAAQNEFYKDYLGLKESHPDFEFAAATLIAKDTEDPYGGFIINQGSMAGISAYDPVITDEGLVGYITEVGLTTAKVTTVLSPELTSGALDNRTGDSGIVIGNSELANDGMCRFSNLSRSCSVAIGDYVVTSGEGIFPSGLLIGSIESVGSDSYNTSIYADIKPFANLSEIRNVMVITAFDGQGGVRVGAEGTDE